MKIDSKNYMVIHGWMRTELNLSGNDLLVYAIIYGFSQLEHHSFNGSLQYLADWCGATKQGIQKNLKNLMDKDLIRKEVTTINGVNFVAYYTTKLYGCTTELYGGIQQSCTNNISNNKEYKKDKKEDISKDISKKKSTFSLNHSVAQRDNKIVDTVIDMYLTICTNLPKIRAVTDKRRKAVQTLIKNHSIEQFKEVFEIANTSAFLLGDNDRGWKADFDWLLQEEKFIRVLEGKYNSKRKKQDKFADEGLATCLTRKGPRKEIDKNVKRKTY